MKKEDKVKKYQDTSGALSNKGLQRGIWFVKHKLLLRRILIITLSAWAFVSVSLGLVIWTKYAAYDFWKDRDLYRSQISQFPNYDIKRDLYQAIPPTFGQPEVFRGAENTYDLITPVKNSNPSIIAHIQYHYQFTGGKTSVLTTSLLPGSDTFVSFLGFEHDTFPARAQLVVDDISWERIDTHFIPDPASFIEARLVFEAENLAFIAEEDGRGSTLSFDLINRSVYSYWQADFLVRMFRGNEPVGVVFVSEPQFLGNETRAIEYRLFQDIAGVSRIELTPFINVFDHTNYMPVGQ